LPAKKDQIRVLRLLVEAQRQLQSPHVDIIIRLLHQQTFFASSISEQGMLLLPVSSLVFEAAVLVRMYISHSYFIQAKISKIENIIGMSV
jgi:hypothetical protein